MLPPNALLFFAKRVILMTFIVVKLAALTVQTKFILYSDSSHNKSRTEVMKQEHIYATSLVQTPPF